jgi:pepF/M3 family oligoendopeptidase
MKPLPAETLPRWDTSNIYSSLEGDDYLAAREQLPPMLDEMESFFDARGIRRAAAVEQVDASLAATLAEALDRANALTRLWGTLHAFVYTFVSTDSYNALAARELSKLEIAGTRAQKLRVRLQGWIGGLAARLPRLLAARPLLAAHAFFLHETARQSRYLMSEELENLAADLVLDSGVALGKLQGSVTSQLKVAVARGGDGNIEELPITVVRNLCFDADAALRERAYHAEIKGWDSIRTTVAACLNGVKGTALSLARRRGRESVLAAALDDNHIDAQTLDAMLGSIRDALPMFRRYLRAKARKLGRERLRWWDIFAPLPGAQQTFTWAEARDFIVEKFGTFSPDLSRYAGAAFERRWIDAQPRDGKRGGAFCMEVLGVEESRILANFDGSFEQVSTLAHELGHGYHNHCQKGLEPLVRGAPMTLAETASIFCETLVAESTLNAASPAEQVAILETQLCGATQVCLDISSRFQFESAVFERRGASELSADDFCDIMLRAQADTYAEAIEPSTYHRYMWLWKPHYYSYEHNFYNFPYAFGHLFALGLFAIFRRQGADFVPRYQELLRATCQDYAAPLAQRFGIDITRREFWRESLDIIEGQVRRFESL